MTAIRAFIAIELPGELKQKIGRLEAQLKNQGASGIKWVKPDAIHLTLKFLGNVEADAVARITETMRSQAPEAAPLSLRAEGLGVFPNLKRPQVIWVGVAGEIDRLCVFQKRLEAGLASLGFEPESRPWSPHLTLARLRDQIAPEERDKLARLITAGSFEATPFTAEGISLIRSELTPDGPLYSRIGYVKLGRGR